MPQPNFNSHAKAPGRKGILSGATRDRFGRMGVALAIMVWAFLDGFVPLCEFPRTIAVQTSLKMEESARFDRPCVGPSSGYNGSGENGWGSNRPLPTGTESVRVDRDSYRTG
jgi:hypothetical protein